MSGNIHDYWKKQNSQENRNKRKYMDTRIGYNETG